MNLTYDVRLWGIREHKGKDRQTGKPRSTFRLRWLVAGVEFGESFQTRPLAESFRSKLVTAQREGTAFDALSGLPEPLARERNSVSWYAHAVEFVDMKWPRSSGNHRKSIAESLANATMALLVSSRGAPSDVEMRRALYGWAFNKTRRENGSMPGDITSTLDWVQRNTVKLAALSDPAVTPKALDTLSQRLDRKAAAAATVARKRAVFYGALGFAVELRRLPSNPIDHLRWTPPRSDAHVDRRSVVNPEQAIALIQAVCEKAPRYVAFFAAMYYSALRPAEVIHLRVEDCVLPERGWGLFTLTGSTPHVGADWADDASAVQEDRELKHRAKNATREVPIPPPLVRALLWHLVAYGTSPDGRLFLVPGYGNKPVSKWSYLSVWRKARASALTDAQQRSPLAARPYDLRHAAVSTWLNAGVPATQVAEWAGHSVAVLLKVYAKCIEGGEQLARQRIAVALGLPDDDA